MTSGRGFLSVRWKLTLSYAAFLMLAGTLLLGVVWLFLLRYIPDTAINTQAGFVPNRSDLLEVFVPPTVVALLVLLAAGLGGGWLLAGYMLAPLTRITQATRIAATGTLSHRIGMDDRHDEFGELAQAFDTMLARIEAHVAEQQRFAANASHELRTPLAIMRTVIDVAEKEPTRDPAAVLARLKSTNDRAVELTEALLLLSRAGRTPTELQATDLSLLAEEAVETLLPFAERHGIRMELEGEAAEALGSPALLLQMITNLVHNAIVHNLPAGGSIWVRTSRTADRAVLWVENTGAEAVLEDLETLAEPFARRAGRIRLDDRPGHGLGLPIVASIVEAHRGELMIEPRDGGGVRVRVELPRASGA